MPTDVTNAGEAVRLAELANLVESTLGQPLDTTTFNALADIQKDMRRAHTAFCETLDNGQTSPRQSLDITNQTLKSAMDKMVSLLGRERFLKIFGEAGLHPEGMIDEKTFLEQHAPLQRSNVVQFPKGPGG